MKVHYCTAGAVLKLLLIVSVAYNCKEQSLNAEGRLDNIRNVLLVGLGVEVFKALAGGLLVLSQIVVGAVCNAPEFAPAEREHKLEVGGSLRVEAKLLRAVVAQTDILLLQTEGEQEVLAVASPVLEPLKVGAGLAEELKLHLLELAHAENELTGGYLVTEGLTYLSNAERNLFAACALDISKVNENTLSSLRAEVNLILAVFGNALEGLEHQVELTDIGKVCGTAVRALDTVLPDVSHHLLVGPAVCVAAVVFNELICAVTGLAVLAVHQRVGEAAHVAGCHPDFRVHEDCGIQRHVVATLLHELAFPRVFYVVLEKAAQRAVVPRVGQTAVNFGAGVYVASVFAERHDFFHGLFFGLQNFLHLLNSFRAAGCCTASCSWMLRL